MLHALIRKYYTMHFLAIQELYMYKIKQKLITLTEKIHIKK